MSGHGRVNSDFCCLLVADFSDHDDVWILAQESAQAGSKSKSNFGIYLALINALNSILYWVFNGSNIYARLV